MTNLIIGHTSHHSAKIWVRGGRSCSTVHVRLSSAGRVVREKELLLGPGEDYTGCVEFSGLLPSTCYEVQASAPPFPAEWSRLKRSASGRFRTPPAPGIRIDQAEPAFTFLLGSCNLSSIRVANLLAVVAGFAGLVAMRKALLRMDDAPFRSASVWRRLLSTVAGFVLKLVYSWTAFRQPPPYRLVSPFLRLSALFGTCRIDFDAGQVRPRVGAIVVGERSKAIGAVVLDAVLHGGAWATSDGPGNAVGTLSLVPMSAACFKEGERLLLDEPFVSAADAGEGNRAVCKVTKIKEEVRRPPAFMLHVGDQIYFDFPRAGDPEPGTYRSAYREAWIEDRMAAHFLAQCPQYMTMDDHEILNNFAWNGTIAAGRRSNARAPRREMKAYFEPAICAYKEYVHRRHPGLGLDPDARCDECKSRLDAEKAFYYSFSYGNDAHFFVTDTRAERLLQPKRMISCCQMAALKAWLREHRDDLLFVVSSVPFVPHINSTADEAGAPQGWSISADKWCAPWFCGQRDEIVRCIWEERAPRVIFLTGDMHCCYYATMRVGEPSAAITIHELCGGPIYQLTLADPRHFYGQYRGSIQTANSKLPYLSRVRQFYSAANAVLRVGVEAAVPVPAVEEGGVRSYTQTVAWDVLATISEPPRRRPEEAISSGRISLQWTERDGA